jgi:hypothetical protein
MHIPLQHRAGQECTRRMPTPLLVSPTHPSLLTPCGVGAFERTIPSQKWTQTMTNYMSPVCSLPINCAIWTPKFPCNIWYQITWGCADTVPVLTTACDQPSKGGRGLLVSFESLKYPFYDNNAGLQRIAHPWFAYWLLQLHHPAPKGTSSPTHALAPICWSFAWINSPYWAAPEIQHRYTKARGRNQT